MYNVTEEEGNTQPRKCIQNFASLRRNDSRKTSLKLYAFKGLPSLILSLCMATHGARKWRGKKLLPCSWGVEKNINLTKIIFQQYGNMHVFIIYYINRYACWLPSPTALPHRTVVLSKQQQQQKKSRIKKKFLKTITKGGRNVELCHAEPRKKKSSTDDF